MPETIVQKSIGLKKSGVLKGWYLEKWSISKKSTCQKVNPKIKWLKGSSLTSRLFGKFCLEVDYFFRGAML